MPRSVILNAVFTLLAGLGILIALLSIGKDVLFSGYPGLSLPQLLVTAAGLIMSLVSFALRSARVRRQVSTKMRKHLASGLVVTAITLIVLEFALTAAGMPTYFPLEGPEAFPDLEPWRACSESGCRYNYDAVVAGCENGELAGRACIINRQGFHDTQGFAVGDDFDERARILALGDSFTYGASAEIGKSYVETVEANLPKSIVWNTGIGANGTNHALAAFRVYAPVLQPHLTILGFTMNDFKDNLFPMDSMVRGVNRLNERFAVRQYRIDDLGNAVKLDRRTLYYRLHAVDPPASEIERLIGITRLGSLALKMIDAVRRGITESFLTSREVDATREYLRTLRDSAMAQDTALLVLLVPHRDDIGTPGLRYQTAIRLMTELEMPYLNPIHLLDAALDYAPSPDDHWNSAGHQKIGAMLSECLAVFQISGDLSDCERVEMP